jgi:pyrroline-5-carboxylate reductase
MAQAVSLGVVCAGLSDYAKIRATDPVPDIQVLAKKQGIEIMATNPSLVEWADVVVMATKPAVVPAVLQQVAPAWRQSKLMVSICAGISVHTYVSALGEAAKVVRVMPNTPCLVGEAATAYAGSPSCTEWELDLVQSIFTAVGGATHRVPEYMLDGVTGLSGSGPAYVYMLIQSLSDAGVLGGLPRAVAVSLATQTVIGAARMVKETGEHPMVLKEAVTSPGGTTIAGVRTLEKMGFNAAIIEAVDAARKRSEELSRV